LEEGMKALIVPKAGQLEFAEIPNPEIGPYDALVRNEICGICNSTDAKLIDGQMSWAPPFPVVLGHESCGTVVVTGAKVRRYRPGDRVTRTLAFWPGTRPGLNVAIGGFAEFGLVRDTQAMADDGDPSLLDDYNGLRQLVAPKHLSPVEAALAISLSETASVLRHLPNLRGKTVAVAGTGVAGLAFILWCKLAGARVIAIGRRAEKLEEAQRLGADFIVDTSKDDPSAKLKEAASGYVDGLIEATGDAPLANALLQALAKDGFATAYGVPPTGAYYDNRWISASVEEHLSMSWTADLLKRGWIKSEWFVSHIWDFSESLRAFDEVRQGKVKKGFIRFPAK
jgi:threonine dehydrogenase-like Zn-dependent dehydrogenase